MFAVTASTSLFIGAFSRAAFVISFGALKPKRGVPIRNIDNRQPTMMEDSDEVASRFETADGGRRAKVKHPLAAFFHLFFRVSALLVYCPLSFIPGLSSHFIELFLTVVLLLAMDFWTVKNVSGRLLVGLRWWNKVEDDGTSNWIFESKKKPNTSYPESVIFWGGLFTCPVLWIFYIFTSLIKFQVQWMIIPIIGVALTGANLIGYVKCRRDAGAKISAMAGQFIGKQVLKQTFSSQEN